MKLCLGVTSHLRKQLINHTHTMLTLLIAPVVAAAGYSFIYLLMGGGLGGAILIFIIAKLLGK